MTEKEIQDLQDRVRESMEEIQTDCKYFLEEVGSTWTGMGSIMATLTPEEKEDLPEEIKGLIDITIKKNFHTLQLLVAAAMEIGGLMNQCGMRVDSSEVIKKCLEDRGIEEDDPLTKAVEAIIGPVKKSDNLPN